eukprot:TRINITY_DN6268_c0_g1_i1.p1 TRINITY_DN6268_c0_g1~~TRINITY_DN6268_c0_g1_i1.p1  ORF type:complete len:202 (+),score=62.29 TRINITY_DN6268_c0_g1_i1:56-661(+)
MSASEDWEILSGPSQHTDSWSAAGAEHFDGEFADAALGTPGATETPTVAGSDAMSRLSMDDCALDVESLDTESAAFDTPVATPVAAPNQVQWPRNEIAHLLPPAVDPAVRLPLVGALGWTVRLAGEGGARPEPGRGANREGDMNWFNVPMAELQALERQRERARAPKMAKHHNASRMKNIPPKALHKASSHRTMYANERNK